MRVSDPLLSAALATLFLIGTSYAVRRGIMHEVESKPRLSIWGLDGASMLWWPLVASRNSCFRPHHWLSIPACCLQQTTCGKGEFKHPTLGCKPCERCRCGREACSSSVA
jgi:hypothetical protein